MNAFLDRWFGLSANRTTVRRELMAGLTTFLAMAYITVVNPGILSEAGMDFGAVFVATCLAAAFGTLVMGLYANYPIALAPGMGQNVFFTYSIVLGLGVAWQTALGAVFISGVIFIGLSILPIREWLVNAIPRSLKLGISAGIGLFLGIIALAGGGIVVANPATIVSLGDLTRPEALLLLAGFMIIAALPVPLTYSIADGIGLGFITYAAIKLLSGRPGECPAAVYAVALVFVLKFGLLA